MISGCPPSRPLRSNGDPATLRRDERLRQPNVCSPKFSDGEAAAALDVDRGVVQARAREPVLPFFSAAAEGVYKPAVARGSVPGDKPDAVPDAAQEPARDDRPDVAQEPVDRPGLVPDDKPGAAQEPGDRLDAAQEHVDRLGAAQERRNPVGDRIGSGIRVTSTIACRALDSCDSDSLVHCTAHRCSERRGEIR